MKTHSKRQFLNLMASAVLFGAITGIFTAVTVLCYKLCASRVIELSEKGYHYLRLHPILIPAVVVALLGIAFLYAFIYKRIPNLRGGGIPTSIGILRGLITFKWLRNLIGTFLLSLTTFLIGVPLGNEGPSVQMGTAIGRGTVFSFAKKHRAWDRYSMTGGACAGFSVATGAPISGIMFAIEEAHQRISPMIIIVSSASVMFASLTTEILAPLLNVSPTLFPHFTVPTLALSDIWIPLVIGIVIGLFAVLFLKYYRSINFFLNKKLARAPLAIRIFGIFLITLAFGLLSPAFVSTGHELILSLFDADTAIPLLLLILLLRATLTLGANSSGITGGMFLPILALGTVLSAILGELLALCGFGEQYHTLILLLGITACIAGMMKTPLTAIFFAIEALACYENILFVIIVAAVPFMITEIFGVKSVNDSVLDNRVEELNEGKTAKRVIDTFVTVQKHSFAIGKQIRDIFWPANLFVLSLKHNPAHDAEVDEHGGKLICEGDLLHVRYVTCNEEQTREELIAIVGEQDFKESEADVI